MSDTDDVFSRSIAQQLMKLQLRKEREIPPPIVRKQDTGSIFDRSVKRERPVNMGELKNGR